MPDEFLKIDELASRVRVSAATVRRWRKHHGLPAHRWGKRTVRYEWGEFQAWSAMQREESNVGQ